MSITYAPLSSRSIIRLEGDETIDFLQGLLTADLSHLRLGHPMFAALLSAQGKVQFDMLLWAGEGQEVFLECEDAARQDLIKRLKLYRLRAKITIEPDDTLIAVAAWGDGLAHPLAEIPEGAAFDPRLRDLGIRLLTPKHLLSAQLPSDWAETSEANYSAHRLSFGVPEGRDEFGYERLFALEANLEELKGVSFKKGCYVGQELTARMKHKTELKKRLLPMALSGAAEPGSAITADGRDIGQLVGRTDHTGFGLFRLDRLSGVLEGDIAVHAGDADAKLIWPAAYLTPPER